MNNDNVLNMGGVGGYAGGDKGQGGSCFISSNDLQKMRVMRVEAEQQIAQIEMNSHLLEKFKLFRAGMLPEGGKAVFTAQPPCWDKVVPKLNDELPDNQYLFRDKNGCLLWSVSIQVPALSDGDGYT